MSKVGRPTKYNEELLKKASQYLDIYESLDQVIPTIEGFCIYLDISRETAYDWASQDDKKIFSDTVKRIKRIQKQVLINKGLEGKFNAKITQLLLGANHSVIEKTFSEISGPGGKAIEQSWTIEFVDAKDNDK